MKKIWIVALGVLVGFMMYSCTGKSLTTNGNTEEGDRICDEELPHVADPDMIVLAKMLLDEKESGKLEDKPYVTYFVDFLGFKQDAKEFVGDFGKVSMSSEAKNDDGKRRRNIRLRTDNTNWIGFMLGSLQEFGLEQTEKEGNSGMLKGKGLIVGYGVNSITIGYLSDK